MSYKEKYYKYKSKYLKLKGGTQMEYNLYIITNDNITQEIYTKIQDLYKNNNQMCNKPTDLIIHDLNLNNYFYMFKTDEDDKLLKNEKNELIKYNFDEFKEKMKDEGMNEFKLYYIHKEDEINNKDNLYAFGFLTHQKKYNIDYLQLLCRNFDKNIIVPKNMVFSLLDNIYNDSANGFYLSPAGDNLVLYYTKWKTPTFSCGSDYMFFIKNEINKEFKERIIKLYNDTNVEIQQHNENDLTKQKQECSIPKLLKNPGPIILTK